MFRTTAYQKVEYQMYLEYVYFVHNVKQATSKKLWSDCIKYRSSVIRLRIM